MKYLTQVEAIRHGDLLLIAVDEMPEVESKPQTQIHGGSHGHPHSIVKGEFYPKREDENILGYLKVQKNGYLTHDEHGEVVDGSSQRKAPISQGIWQVRVQLEDTHEGFKEVED